MKNEEVMISIKANIEPLRKSMQQMINDVGLGVSKMEDFNAVINSANKKELKGITKNLTTEIENTKMLIKDMEQELVIALNTNESPKVIDGLRENIGVANYELKLMQSRLKQVGNNQSLNVLQQLFVKLKEKTKEAQQEVENLKKRLKRIVISSAIFAGIRMIKSLFSEASQESDIFSGTLGGIKTAISSTLIPIFDALGRAIQKAFAWVSGLLNFLSGGKINLIQKGIDGVNKKISKTGSTAKKTGKAIKGSLGGLDEITNIDSDSGSSGGGGGGPSDDGLANQLSALEEMKTLSESFDFSWAEPLKAVWDFMVEYGDIIIGIIAGIVAVILLYNAAMAIYNIVMAPVNLVILAIVAAVVALIAIIVLCIKHWDEIKEVVSNVVNKIVEWVKGLWEKVSSFFQGLWDDIVSIFGGIAEWFGNLFSTAWDLIKEAWNGVVAFFKGIWDGIKAIFNFVVEYYKTIFTTAWTVIKTVWNVVVNWFKGIWDGIKNVFSVVGTWFSDVFTKAWNGIKNAFSKVTSFFKGIWEDIKSIFSKVGEVIGGAITDTVKKAVNTVLSTAVKIINGFISAINLAIDVINAIPGVSIKRLNKLSVPSFDVGTNYVPDDMLAMVHKGERIVPEKYNNDDWVSDGTDMTETNSLLEELINVVYNKNLSIDGDSIGKVSLNYIQNESRRRGEALI